MKYKRAVPQGRVVGRETRREKKGESEGGREREMNIKEEGDEGESRNGDDLTEGGQLSFRKSIGYEPQSVSPGEVA